MKPKVIWQCIYPILLHFGISLVVGYIYMFSYMFWMVRHNQADVAAVTSQVMDSYVDHSLYLMAVSAILTIPILYFLLTGRRKKEGMIQWQKEEKISNWALLVLMSACLCISFNALISYSGIERFSQRYQETAQVLYSGGFWLEILVVGILVPISEEFIFRGMIFETLCQYIKPMAAGGISALMFAVYHGNLVQGIYAFCIGWMLAFFCKRYGSLLAPIIAHITANIVSVCITEIDLIADIFENSIAYIVLTILTTFIWIGGTAVLMKRKFKKIFRKK